MTKRGPKRKAGKRTASGRLSQSSGEVIARLTDAHDREERDTLSVGLEARVRVWGIDPMQSRDQMAGSVVGRLTLAGELTRQQYDAAQSWLTDLRVYRRAIAAPKGMGAVDINAIRGDSTDIERVEWYRRCCNRMQAARAALQAEQDALRLKANLWAAIDLMLDSDLMLRHLVGDLRLALNALARHYGHA